MKWKFRASANVELKFCRKLLLKNLKSHSWSFSWWFFVENRYNLVQGHKKKHPLLGIYAILWKYMTRFPILHILVNFLSPFAFQFALESPKSSNSNNLILRSKSLRFSDAPFRSLKLLFASSKRRIYFVWISPTAVGGLLETCKKYGYM